MDATESGTYVSALNCQACDAGVCLPQSPSQLGSPWICQNCQNEITEGEVQEIIDNFESITLEEARKLLHPNHFLLASLNNNKSE